MKNIASAPQIPESVSQSRFKRGDRVQFGQYSTGKVLGHQTAVRHGKPVVELIVLLDPEHRVNRWTPIENWVETDQVISVT
jgi:hypothetical protein